jgi:hypothetical protein
MFQRKPESCPQIHGGLGQSIREPVGRKKRNPGSSDSVKS